MIKSEHLRTIFNEVDFACRNFDDDDLPVLLWEAEIPCGNSEQKFISIEVRNDLNTDTSLPLTSFVERVSGDGNVYNNYEIPIGLGISLSQDREIIISPKFKGKSIIKCLMEFLE